jgi:ABC-2 type transport system ATP-binding protein
MTSVLNAEKLSKSYGQRSVVDELSLCVEPGELVALVGANGAGKTTTLAMLSGQLVPDAGQIKISGHEVYSDPIAARRALGYVAQDLILPPYLTIEEMAEFAVAVKERVFAEKEFRRLLELAGLADDGDRLIGELSHGMQRKAAWVVALVSAPKVLIVDEGLAGLDATSCRAIVDEVANQIKSGMAVLWTEHDLEGFSQYLDRVLVLAQGKLVETISGDVIREADARDPMSSILERWAS